ncbi:S8 family serine peptidase [Halopiger aswanensis]|uniref:Subtilisin family serine protease n=1 Tax=Halopiger aswanensis TaxID=148449 RepID=A0A419WGS5_9EURY|nr:S8 family serine peptidase [Halopiger aswanensis]RKD94731.1 subtilisin family serine protease [Halopiger aswanensis]
MTSRRGRAGRSEIVPIVVCLLLLSAGPIAAGASAMAAGHSDGPPTDDGIRIDDDLPANGTTVEVIVRLEDAPATDTAVAADETDVDIDRLEEHAEATQDPLLEYAADTPGITVAEEFWVTNAVLLEVNLERVDLETFERFEAVEAVHENFEVPVPDRPAEPTAVNGTPTASAADGTAQTTQGSSVTPAIAAIDVPSVWNEYETRGEGVRVAVLDTGIEPSHPDLELYTDDPSDPTYPGGWAEFNDTGHRVPDSTPHDTGVHGTHVSGTVAGGAATGTAIGVAPEADLMHGLVMDETNGTFAQILAGMEWALAEDADVINMSLGTTGTYPQFIEPIRNANLSGTIVVGAIGNEGPETSGSPGNVYETLSVGAVAADGTVAPFSGGERLNRTDWAATPSDWPDAYTVPDVVAPGVDIASSMPDGGYARMPGTSMAAPHVAGTAALLRSVEPDATPADLSSVLTETTQVPADDRESAVETRYGTGIIDADAAAAELLERTSEVESSMESGGDTTGGQSDESAVAGGHTAGDAAGVDWPGQLATIGLAIVLGLCVVTVLSGFGVGRLER